MNILTFDIEDWFHILDNEQTQNVLEWSNFESRLEHSMDIIFEILSYNNQEATFFIVGWIAEKHPNIIKKISDLGYEIGSHTHHHQLVYNQTAKDFNEDLKKSIDTLQQISGKKVKSFRAPGFSITPKTPWAFESLIKNGIEIDCSIFPTKRAHGGYPNFGSNEPVLLEFEGNIIKEFPINVTNILGQETIFSGGGYFRLLPYSIINKLSKKSNYIMSYFHPRDFDKNQPIVPGLNMARKFKSYYGLSTTKNKLEKWIKDFEFIDLKTADSKIDWMDIDKIIL